MRQTRLVRLLTAAVLLAAGMVLPFLTGQIPAIGSMLSPLHIPVFIGGLCCGWSWGAVLGFVLPLLRSLVFGMPPLFPTAFCMAFEMAGYGALCGLCYAPARKRFGAGKHYPAILAAMVPAMLGGRAVYGIVMALCMGLTGGSYTFATFLSSCFVSAWPGILLHLVIVPPIVLALERARLSCAARDA